MLALWLGRVRLAWTGAGRRFPRALLLLRGGSGPCRASLSDLLALWLGRARPAGDRAGRYFLLALRGGGRPSCTDLLYKLCGIVRLPT